MNTSPGQNLAFFADTQSAVFLGCLNALTVNAAFDQLFIVTSSAASKGVVEPLLANRADLPPTQIAHFENLGFFNIPIYFPAVQNALIEWLQSFPTRGPNIALAIDMSWGLETTSAAANFESWMSVAQHLTDITGGTIVSAYNRRLLIDEQLLAALRGHPNVLTQTAVIANPHWLPPDLISKGSLRNQVNFWLGTISPDLNRPQGSANGHDAEGTDPMWLLNRAADEPSSATTADTTRERWKVRCFGRLRIYRNDGSQVRWDSTGGATLKIKTLFAFLLQRGGRGASAEELCDLLWPEVDSIQQGRNRLYHAVRCLRQALKTPNDPQDTNFVLRDGSNYVLVPPERSWLDIATFEQLCRQAQGHIKSGAQDEALICLQAADRLYTGDLFEDIPAEYADDNERDWCWSRRYWLRDMSLKVQRDAAQVFRQRQDFSSALAHCQKALAVDPVCEIAHEEAMEIFSAQGRTDAIERQYRLYLTSLAHFDDRPKSESLIRSYQRLMK